MALGGAIGDPLNGGIFDLRGSYQPLFLLMAGYTALAFAAVLFIPSGAGEADAHAAIELDLAGAVRRGELARGRGRLRPL